MIPYDYYLPPEPVYRIEISQDESHGWRVQMWDRLSQDPLVDMYYRDVNLMYKFMAAVMSSTGVPAATLWQYNDGTCVLNIGKDLRSEPNRQLVSQHGDIITVADLIKKANKIR